MALKTLTLIPFPIFSPIPTTTDPTTTKINFSRWNNPNAADKFDRPRRTQHQIESDLRRHHRFQSADNLAEGSHIHHSPTTPTFKSVGTPSSPSIPSIPGKISKYSKTPNYTLFRNQNPNPNYPRHDDDDDDDDNRKLQRNSKLPQIPNPNPNYPAFRQQNPNPNPNYPAFRNRNPNYPAFRQQNPNSNPNYPRHDDDDDDDDGNVAFRKLQRNSRLPQIRNSNPNYEHPAFRKVQRKSKLPKNDETGRVGSGQDAGEVTMKVGEEGLSYVVPGAPFEFMYSYTETPKVKPLALREAPVVPFGMARPWTGRKPFPASKKKLKEFDSFTPPPANKKGVKPVQRPGPFLPGSGPKYVISREEVLGEALTSEEVTELVEGCKKTKRQLNMGRDGLTHNMLDNIHAHWKRRRVCKIKCKGVCTVDMDNVCDQLEEKTGGKIIYRRGGVVYLFRGRNYNYRTRPRFPLMLWKPVTPVYPRLVQRVPEGLTLEEATVMRKRGRDLTPICKLGKNGVYIKLVKHVREAFEACELVRIDCQGLNPSDYRKIGAKLMDLVPCVLISFEREHVLMWRGRDWKPSILLPENGGNVEKISDSDIAALAGSDDEDELTLSSSNISIHDVSVEKDEESFEGNDVILSISNNPSVVDDGDVVDDDDVESSPENTCENETRIIENCSNEKDPPPKSAQSDCMLGVLGLLREALENGSAVILDENSLDADVVYKRSAAFAETAPPGPVFRHRPPPQKVATAQKPKQKRETRDLKSDEVVEGVAVPEKKSKEKKPKERKNYNRTPKVEDFKDEYLNLVPQGSLKVDELAKLLA